MQKYTEGIGMLFDKAVFYAMLFFVGVVPDNEPQNFPASRCRILCGHYRLASGFFYGDDMPKRGDVHPETGLVYWDKSGGIERWRDAETFRAWIEKTTARRKTPEGAAKNRANAELSRKKKPWMRRDYYIRNKARERASNVAWRNRDNPKYIAYLERAKASATDRARRYYLNNREEINKRVREKRRNNAELKILGSIRNRLFCALKRVRNIQKSKRTLELVGCSMEFLKEYLASKFLPGMSWANHGKQGWHIDHIKPCAMFDMTDQKQQEECFHYSNLQPLWAIDNTRKGARWIG